MSGPLTSIHALLIFLAFFIAVIASILVRKFYYFFRYNKRVYVFPRINVKGIANVAMIISIATAVLLLLTFVSGGLLGVMFRAYPGLRVTIEGILIKIGGLLFGPIIGVFIGVTTDLLSVALTAGMFHYGYFLAAIMYGLLSGIVRTILNITEGKQVHFTFWSTILIAVVAVASILYIWSQPKPFHITFLIEFNIPQWQLALLIASIYIMGLVVLWITTFAYYQKSILYNFGKLIYWFKYKHKFLYFRKRLANKKNVQKFADKQLNWVARFGEDAHESSTVLIDKKQRIEIANRNNWLSYFTPVLVVIVFGEALINTFILPEFDVMFSPTGTDMYNMWLGIRTSVLVLTIPLNILIVYPVYRIVSPAMRYNYTSDSVESRVIPLKVS